MKISAIDRALLQIENARDIRLKNIAFWERCNNKESKIYSTAKIVCFDTSIQKDWGI